MSVEKYFSQTYAEAREKFIAAARIRGLEVERTVHPDQVGPGNEALSIDTALFLPADAEAILVVSSGTHGVEGFCGSGCQIGLLNDDELFRKLAAGKIALLLVHAVNPYGFAHLRRVNEDNVDLNRNSVNFQAAASINPAYLDVDPLLLPKTWPPSASDEAALNNYVASHGMQALRDATTAGQYRIPDGMFYGGAAACWSTQQMSAILSRHAAKHSRMIWIDIHTGLGVYGHGEKIFASTDPLELGRAISTWGADVLPIADPGSISSVVQGALVNIAYGLLPAVEKTILTLEFGTLDLIAVMQALRADHWMHRHPNTSGEQTADIKKQLRDAFYCDAPEWKGLVYGQTRVAILQAVSSLSKETTVP
ncbi:M14 family metallopeptidase [Undibacterium sp.]|uniref:M14 family metallopeptidase n=1 Tax=Undibacterium sp. TaxID=1914977 RepID=UPI002CBB804C|nr:M14 family metallopeptidase [Undibacterium sp.]HTD05667.1 M14 family metallopeptidase [Undibacterium sp.]